MILLEFFSFNCNKKKFEIFFNKINECILNENLIGIHVKLLKNFNY